MIRRERYIWSRDCSRGASRWITAIAVWIGRIRRLQTSSEPQGECVPSPIRSAGSFIIILSLHLNSAFQTTVVSRAATTSNPSPDYALRVGGCGVNS